MIRENVVCQTPEEPEAYLVGTQPSAPRPPIAEVDTSSRFDAVAQPGDCPADRASSSAPEFDRWTASDEMCARTIEKAREQGKPVVVDEEGKPLTFEFAAEQPHPRG